MAIVSIAPLIGLVQPLIDAVAGDQPAKRVVSLVPVGRSEHGHEITPAVLNTLLSADLIVLVGAGLEPQVERFLADRVPADGRTRRVVRFAEAAGIPDDGHDHAHHEHGPDGECIHHGADPHLWLDPVLVERLVSAVEQAIVDMVGPDRPAAARVREAAESLRGRVRAVHERYALACGRFTTRTIVVGHDAWRRLADRYGLETVAIAGLAATEPTPGALERAKSTVKDKGLRVVFAEPQLSDRAARRIAQATGAEIRRLDPLGNGDWFAMMEANLRELQRALGPESPDPVGSQQR